MKQFANLSLAFALTVSSLSMCGQNAKYPFEVNISGKGSHSIIFIPGFGCSGKVWDETRSGYEKDFTCCTLTMAGFAGTPADSNPSFQSWEKGIADYIQQNKINKPIIIGHSMGGDLALALAADYPDLVSKIIVVDALPCLTATRDSTFKSKDTINCNKMISMMTSMAAPQFYYMEKYMISTMVADTSKSEQIVQWMVKSDRKTLGELFCELINLDLRNKISSIKCPALILLEPSFADSKPDMVKQYANLKTVNLQYATKGLHFIMYDDATWYNEQLSAFLK